MSRIEEMLKQLEETMKRTEQISDELRDLNDKFLGNLDRELRSYYEEQNKNS